MLRLVDFFVVCLGLVGFGFFGVIFFFCFVFLANSDQFTQDAKIIFKLLATLDEFSLLVYSSSHSADLK